jgi:hypothetical protein
MDIQFAQVSRKNRFFRQHRVHPKEICLQINFHVVRKTHPTYVKWITRLIFLKLNIIMILRLFNINRRYFSENV